MLNKEETSRSVITREVEDRYLLKTKINNLPRKNSRKC